VRQGIERIAAGTAGVVGTNQVLTMHFGPEEILVALSRDFDDAISAAQLEAAVADIERGIRHEFPDVTRVFVEARSAADHLRRR
jgi:divalent metal cation (Fe/Co/Zn/Cd) transporter